jgi:hypothetical protein
MTAADDRRKISTTLKEVIRDDGIQGLWRGTVPTLVRYVPIFLAYPHACDKWFQLK